METLIKKAEKKLKLGESVDLVQYLLDTEKLTELSRIRGNSVSIISQRDYVTTSPRDSYIIVNSSGRNALRSNLSSLVVIPTTELISGNIERTPSESLFVPYLIGNAQKVSVSVCRYDSCDWPPMLSDVKFFVYHVMIVGCNVFFKTWPEIVWWCLWYRRGWFLLVCRGKCSLPVAPFASW